MSEKSKIILPTKSREPIRVNPKNLIIFSRPKIGKTSAMVQLPDSLLIDLEKGAGFVKGVIYDEINNVNDIFQLGLAIKEANYPYKFICVDTITKLEEYATDYAEYLYASTSMGKNWFAIHKKKYGSILNLPDGAGYGYLRTAMIKIVDFIKTLAPNIIFSGHVKDSRINKDGSDFTALDLDLTGKISRIIAANSDGLGYMYRKDNTQNYISFTAASDTFCGSRSPHLNNQDILISELLEDGTLKTYWDKIYK